MAQRLTAGIRVPGSGFRENGTGSPTHWEWVALAFLLVLGAALRFYDLGGVKLWYDEQVQLERASRPTLLEVWQASRTGGPFGPAQVLENAVSMKLFGETRTAFRFPAVIDGVIAIGLLWMLGRRWISPRAGLIAAALLCVSGLHIQFSREGRPYALIVLTAILQVHAFLAVVRTPTIGRGLLLALATFVAVGAHPVMVLATAGIGVGALAALALTGRPSVDSPAWKSAAVSALALIAGVGLSYLAFYSGGPTNPFNPTPPEKSLVAYIAEIYAALGGGYWGNLWYFGAVSYVVCALSVAGVGVAFARKEWRWPLFVAAGVAAAGVLPIITAYRAGSFVVHRYSIFAMPFLFLLAAAALDAILDRLRRPAPERLTPPHALIAPLLALALLGSMVLHKRSPYDLEKFKIDTPTDPLWPTLARP